MATAVRQVSTENLNDLAQSVAAEPERRSIPGLSQLLEALAAPAQLLPFKRPMLASLAGALPASVQALVGAIATFPLPPVNMIATNVPGPHTPLYAMGRRMIDYYPYVPVGYAVGCGCAIMSYDQKLYFGLTSDVQAMPDVEILKKFLEESFIEVRAAVGVGKILPQSEVKGAKH